MPARRWRPRRMRATLAWRVQPVERVASNGAVAGVFPMAVKLYLDDPYQRTFDAEIVVAADGWCALSRTAFYPGGGGQPADRGQLVVEGMPVAVTAVREDEAGAVWHHLGRELSPGTPVRGE